MTWHSVYKRISLIDDQTVAGTVLDDCERESRFKLNKWKILRVVKELRKYRHFKHALQVYEWMNDRTERFRISTSDTAIQLDLLAKVKGVLKAEEYFFSLPDTLKDKRTYGALLNVYVQSKMRDRAESLMKKLQDNGYASYSLVFNLMMTLYLNLKDYDKIDTLVSDMRAENIRFDLYSYNIWISSCGNQGSVEKMEQVVELMNMDESVNPNWSTFSTLATMYIKLGDMEKAASCLKMVESKIAGRDRIPYHYLLTLYSSLGRKDEVHRIWNVYKSTFENVANLGYQTVISSLIRLNDIEGAKQIYKDWVSVQLNFDPRITNILMGWYSREGLFEEARGLFTEMVELGGKGNSLTWEILAEGKIRERRVSEALSCLKEAALVDRSKGWKPKPVNVSSILKLCEEYDDVASKDILIGILRQTGCFEDEAYMSYIPLSNDAGSCVNKSLIEKSINEDEGDDRAQVLVNQLQEIL